MNTIDTKEKLERWRTLLGGDEADGIGVDLTGKALAMDRAMAALYDAGERRGGLGASAPSAARWLADIREYFPTPVVRVIQRDAIDRLGMQRLLLEPEMLLAVEPDINLVTLLMSLSGVIPLKAKATARLIVQRVVRDLQKNATSPCARRWWAPLIAPAERVGLATARSTGTVPSARTSSTIRRSTKPSSPRSA